MSSRYASFPTKRRATPVPSLLDVSVPMERQVFQRGATNGTTLVRGTTDRIFTTIEVSASVRQGGTELPWTTVLTRAPGSGAFETTFALAPGWYDVSIRTKNGSTVQSEVTVSRVGVGDVFIVVGQSNVANSAEIPSTPSSDRASAFDWVNGTWQFGADPDPGASFDGPGGTPWTFFLDSIIGTTNCPAAVVNVGIGGSSVLSWTPAGNLHYPRLSSALTAFPGNNGFRAIIWGQGETDADSPVTPSSEYIAYLEDVIDSSRAEAGWSIPWIISQQTRCGPVHSDAINAAQLLVATTYSNCFPAGNFDQYVAGYRVNNCHWNLAGQELIGGLWADAVRAAFGW